MEIIVIRKTLISMSIISTSLTVPGQPSPRFHVEDGQFESSWSRIFVSFFVFAELHCFG